jgi:hypothetical protein
VGQESGTYQEGFLAIRRLVFTAFEVFYVCNNAVCQESVHYELQPTADDFAEGLKSQLNDYFPGKFPATHTDVYRFSRITSEGTLPLNLT